MNEEIQVKRQTKLFLFALFLVGAVESWHYFEFKMTEFNTTLFALNYQYGFISRGMLGTLWKLLDMLLPADLMTYGAIYKFNLLFTIVTYALLFLFFYLCLTSRFIRRDSRYPETVRNSQYLSAFIGVFTFPDFFIEEMFGRLDIYLVFVMLFVLILLVTEKAEWLTVPAVLFAMCIHQGFVFTNFSIILVVLFAKALLGEGRRRKKYLWIFFLSLISASILLFYFELSGKGTEAAHVNDIIRAAQQLSWDGKSYNKSIIQHEVLGNSVFFMELRYHFDNYREFPAFLLLSIPWILIAIRFFRGLRSDEKNRVPGKKRALTKYGWINLAYSLGGLTIVPEMILKVDYGRYAYMTFFYYLATALVLISMGYQPITEQIQQVKLWIRTKCSMPALLLVYAFFMTPFFDVIMNAPTYKVSQWLFGWIHF